MVRGRTGHRVSFTLDFNNRFICTVIKTRTNVSPDHVRHDTIRLILLADAFAPHILAI